MYPYFLQLESFIDDQFIDIVKKYYNEIILNPNNLYISTNHKNESAHFNAWVVNSSYSIHEYIFDRLNTNTKEIPNLLISIIENGTNIIPHIDSNRRTSINIMVECNDEKTIFYESKVDPVKNLYGSFKNRDFYLKTFDKDYLTEKCSFIAKPKDIYLINVSKPHSVNNCDPNKKRLFLSLSYRTKFDSFLDNPIFK